MFYLRALKVFVFSNIYLYIVVFIISNKFLLIYILVVSVLSLEEKHSFIAQLEILLRSASLYRLYRKANTTVNYFES